MSATERHLAEAEKAIASAEQTLTDLAPAKKSKLSRSAATARNVPPVKRWWLPVGIILVLFVGQALVAALVDDTTVGAVFAVGAVLVAVLAAIVAVLSYAQQAAVPFTDIVKILDQLLKALEALKSAQKEDGGGESREGEGGDDDEPPTEEASPPPAQS